ncbi:MAG: ABC transporter substrate-binding protein [Bacteroidetes bacterium]|nr:ABC transporter substrate-binding protein [Bacteroidota bacterium]
MKFRDQIGNEISIEKIPSKIISIVPSQSELLSDLGLEEEVVAITKYCVHPKNWFDTKIKIGGTKKLNIEKIKELKPDLIIGNKEENEKSQIQELQKHFPVWISDIKNLEQALEMIEAIGKMTGKEKRALDIQNNIREQFSLFKLQTSNFSVRSPSDKLLTSKVLYLIWKKPFITAGKETFINHLLEMCGLSNVVTRTRYPEISAEEIQKLNPELIFLSSEPYPFRQKHIEEFQSLCPKGKIVLVDGEMFSWYGTRLLYAPSYFERLLKNL